MKPTFARCAWATRCSSDHFKSRRWPCATPFPTRLHSSSRRQSVASFTRATSSLTMRRPTVCRRTWLASGSSVTRVCCCSSATPPTLSGRDGPAQSATCTRPSSGSSARLRGASSWPTSHPTFTASNILCGWRSSSSGGSRWSGGASRRTSRPRASSASSRCPMGSRSSWRTLTASRRQSCCSSLQEARASRCRRSHDSPLSATRSSMFSKAIGW